MSSADSVVCMARKNVLPAAAKTLSSSFRSALRTVNFLRIFLTRGQHAQAVVLRRLRFRRLLLMRSPRLDAALTDHFPAPARMVIGGTSKINATLREPQRGHFRRLSRRDNGNAAPRVHTSVSISR